MIERKIVISRVWRSQWQRMILFFVLCIASVLLSEYLPQSIIEGRLFSIGDNTIFLTLPLFSLLPLYGLFNVALPIYDARFTIDNKGMETKIGILSLNQTIVRVRFEDIRSIELRQTLLERMIDVGTLDIGSAATSDIEISFSGIGSPKAIQTLIQQERDLRLKKMTNSATARQAAY